MCMWAVEYGCAWLYVDMYADIDMHANVDVCGGM